MCVVGVEGDGEADEVAPGTETAPGVESSVTSQVESLQHY